MTELLKWKHECDALSYGYKMLSDPGVVTREQKEKTLVVEAKVERLAGEVGMTPPEILSLVTAFEGDKALTTIAAYWNTSITPELLGAFRDVLEAENITPYIGYKEDITAIVWSVPLCNCPLLEEDIECRIH